MYLIVNFNGARVSVVCRPIHRANTSCVENVPLDHTLVMISGKRSAIPRRILDKPRTAEMGGRTVFEMRFVSQHTDYGAEKRVTVRGNETNSI